MTTTVMKKVDKKQSCGSTLKKGGLKQADERKTKCKKSKNMFFSKSKLTKEEELITF